jgi:nucleotide-binding universal stress UspA family protein
MLELRREAEQLLNEARARILPHHPGIASSIREGLPANEILSRSGPRHYDLVVMGATGATDMSWEACPVKWRGTPCSVLVVPVPE